MRRPVAVYARRLDVQRSRAPCLEVARRGAVQGFAGEQDRLIRRFEHRGPVRQGACVSSVRLGRRPTSARHGSQDRRPRPRDVSRWKVRGAAEGDQVPAGFEHAPALSRPGFRPGSEGFATRELPSGLAGSVPGFAVEGDPVGRVGDDAINRSSRAASPVRRACPPRVSCQRSVLSE